MLRKGMVLILLLSVGMFLVLPAGAKEGSIRILTDAEAVSVYRLGTAEATGFRLDDIYGGGYLTFDDTLSPELASWFSRKVSRGCQGHRDGESFLVDGLTEGLYLIKAEDDGFSPCLVTLPWDGYQWQVEVDPMNTALPQTGDGVGIAMFAMSASGAGIALLGRRKRC